MRCYCGLVKDGPTRRRSSQHSIGLQQVSRLRLRTSPQRSLVEAKDFAGAAVHLRSAWRPSGGRRAAARALNPYMPAQGAA